MYLPPPKHKFVLDTYHPKDCSVNLTTHYQYFYSNNPSLSDIQVDNNLTYSKTPMSNWNHKDVMYALEEPDGTCDPNQDDCSFYDIYGLNSLRYKVYYPKKTLHDYIAKPLPAVVLYHPGGFAECPQYEMALMETLCEEFSRRGFVAFTVEYRRGRIKDINTDFTSVQQQLAQYRGQQDARGFIRTIVQKQREETNNGTWNYLIDFDQFFIGGASAGGVMVLSCGYFRNQNMIDQSFPNAVGSPAIKDVLGPVQADYYYGDVSSQNWPKIAGVLNMWAGIAIPKSYDGGDDSGVTEATFFQGGGANANPPLIAFHGVKDIVFPFDDGLRQDIKLSIPPLTGTNYNSENRCLNTNDYYTVPGYPPVLIKMCSSLNMYNILKQLNRYTELYYDCDMKHGLGTKADFGIGTSDITQVTIYIAQRAANFFQAVMNGAKNFGDTGRALFRECQNNRTLCSTTSNAPACNNNPYTYEQCP